MALDESLCPVYCCFFPAGSIQNDDDYTVDFNCNSDLLLLKIKKRCLRGNFNKWNKL